MIQTDKGQFKLKFKNGYEISIINGFGSYSENKFKYELFMPSKNSFEIKSKDCEIAIIYKEEFVTKKFIDCGDDVLGYISSDELADIIYMVKNYKGDSNENNRRN